MLSQAGSERAEGCTSPSFAETSLLLARSPSLRAPLGVIPVASCYGSARPATKAPDPRCTYGVVAARRPPMHRTVQLCTYRNLCCTWYADLRASLAPYGLRGGVANGAGPWRCTAGVTPASTRTWDRTTEARTGPGPLCPRNGEATTHNPENMRRHLHWSPRRPADGQQRAALRRGGDGTQSRGLISPSRRMFSTAPVRGLSSWCLRVSLKSTSAQQCPA